MNDSIFKLSIRHDEVYAWSFFIREKHMRWVVGVVFFLKRRILIEGGWIACSKELTLLNQLGSFY